MKKIIYIFIFLITSCSTLKKEPSFTKEEIELRELNFPQAFTSEIDNGAVKKIQLIYPFQEIKAKLFCGKNEIAIGTPRDGLIGVYISTSRHKESGSFMCEYRFTVGGVNKTVPVAKFNINNANYPLRRITVPKQYAKLDDQAIKRWKKEVARLDIVYAGAIADRALFTKSFIKPLNSKVTAGYGSKRVFNDMKHSWHSGIDMRARPGTRIPASNRGKVVLARDHFFTGKTVILDHGLGIMTMYCHLSQFNVGEGDIVPQGATLAYSGNTGRSSGPHLHWGVRVNGHWVDGFSLLKEGI